MKLSVIIPNYNNEKYLSECINSILKQTYKPYEIIVFDDCSTDNSRKIIEGFERKYKHIKGIYSNINQGVSKARHNAIVEAEGDYITMIDSDDIYIDINKLANEVELIRKYRDEEKKNIIAYSRTVLMDVNGNRMEERNKYFYMEGNISFKLLSRLKARYTPRDFILRKDMYMSINGYDFNHNLYEDWDLDIRLAEKYEFYCTKGDGTGYRQHSNGLSSQDMGKHANALKTIFRKNLDIFHGYKRYATKFIFYLINAKAFVKRRILWKD